MEYITYEIFPFDRVKCGSDIAIYGFGNVGKRYVNQLLALDYCNIKCIIDKNKAGTSYQNIKIDATENIPKYKNCIFVIAIASISLERVIRKLLLSYGISAEKIISVIRGVSMPVTNRSFVARCNDDLMVTLNGNVYGISELEKQNQLWELLNSYMPVGYDFIRIGNKNDGGYLMLDDFMDSTVAYSFGINTDVTWDSDMVDRGYEVYMYDHTINELPYERDGFRFFKKGIADKKNHVDDVEHLEDIIRMNNHLEESNMILKMDVEGAEWGFISLTNENILKKFRQCVFEFHNLLDMNKFDLHMECIKKLNKVFMPVHVHANNYGDVICCTNKIYPDSIEVTYVNKEYYSNFTKREKNIHKLDAPCNPFMDEILV